MFAEHAKHTCAAKDCSKRKVQDTIRHDGLKLMFRSMAHGYLHKQQSTIADQIALRLEHKAS